MNHYTRNVKINQLDCFKPWQTQRNKSCYPPRHPKCSTTTHRVAFADTRQGRTLSPTKGHDSLHSVFVNHLRRQVPTMVRNNQKLHMMYKRGKDNHNVNIKQNYDNKNHNEESVFPKLRFQTNKRNNVYFNDDATRFYSSSETNMSSNINITPCRIQSVRNVIEKFNKLSKHETSITPKETFKEKKKDSNLTLLHVERKSKDSIPEKEKHEKINEEHKNRKNNKITKKKESGVQLRSQSFHNKIICDDMLELFKPTKMESVQKIPCKAVVKMHQLQMDRTKELVSAHTQTSPCPSVTNIMINVYNQKSPRIIQHGHLKLSPMEIKISQDKNQTTKLLISQEKDIYELEEIEITKKSVRACVEKFEDHLKKNGVTSEKGMNDGKIFAKIRSNYLLKQQYQPILSPKAKSVPF